MDRFASARYPSWQSGIDPAPGDLRIVQAFVNTLDIEKGTDDLATARGLARWLVEWNLTGKGSTITEKDRRQATSLREGFRELLLSNNGYEADRSRLTALGQLLEHFPLRCALDEDANFALVAVGSGWPRAAARLLTVAVRAMGDGTWSHLKACLRDDCQWAFFDNSKNHSGKWCSMDGCGNIMKARAYRLRRRGD